MTIRHKPAVLIAAFVAGAACVSPIHAAPQGEILLGPDAPLFTNDLSTECAMAIAAVGATRLVVVDPVLHGGDAGDVDCTVPFKAAGILTVSDSPVQGRRYQTYATRPKRAPDERPYIQVLVIQAHHRRTYGVYLEQDDGRWIAGPLVIIAESR